MIQIVTLKDVFTSNRTNSTVRRIHSNTDLTFQTITAMIPSVILSNVSSEASFHQPTKKAGGKFYKELANSQKPKIHCIYYNFKLL